jgi:glycine/D-amino acid oxidase-like deaminating enzyme
MPKRVIVVGGGIAGLCTAVALVKRGVKPIRRESLAASTPTPSTSASCNGFTANTGRSWKPF